MERLLAALEQEGTVELPPPHLDLFVAGDDLPAVFALCIEARRAGLRAECDPLGRSLKAQFRHADRLGARRVAIVPGQGGPVALRDMETREQRDLPAEDVVAAVRAAVSP